MKQLLNNSNEGRELYMKKRKSDAAILTVKTGTVGDFFDTAKKVMRLLDKKEPLKPSHTLVFTDPLEMSCFLIEKKI